MTGRWRIPVAHRLAQDNGGCDFGEDPTRTAHDAHIVWDALLDPGVLPLRAVPTSEAGFRLKPSRGRIDEAIGADGVRHVAIVSGCRRVRVDLLEGSLIEGPVRLIVDCADLATMRRASCILGCLEFLARTGVFPAWLMQGEPRMIRHVQLLRVQDARSAGAVPREIALALFGADMVADGWSGTSDFIKSRTRRLIADAVAMSQGRWRSLMSRSA